MDSCPNISSRQPRGILRGIAVRAVTGEIVAVVSSTLKNSWSTSHGDRVACAREVSATHRRLVQEGSALLAAGASLIHKGRTVFDRAMLDRSRAVRPLRYDNW